MCPGDVISSSVKQILAYGKVVRPALGIAFAPDQSSESLGVKGEEGASMKGEGGGQAHYWGIRAPRMSLEGLEAQSRQAATAAP